MSNELVNKAREGRVNALETLGRRRRSPIDRSEMIAMPRASFRFRTSRLAQISPAVAA